MWQMTLTISRWFFIFLYCPIRSPCPLFSSHFFKNYINELQPTSRPTKLKYSPICIKQVDDRRSIGSHSTQSSWAHEKLVVYHDVLAFKKAPWQLDVTHVLFTLFRKSSTGSARLASWTHKNPHACTHSPTDRQWVCCQLHPASSLTTFENLPSPNSSGVHCWP